MQIQKNMCVIDRLARLIVGAGLVYIAILGHVIENEVLRVMLGVLGIVNIGSSITGLCPIYFLAKITTLGGKPGVSGIVDRGIDK